MPRDLFADVVRPSISSSTRKWYLVPLSLLSHSAIAVLLIALPILAPAIMPAVLANDGPIWIAALPAPPPPPVPSRRDPVPPAVDRNLAPVDAPSSIAKEPVELRDFVDTPIVGLIGGSDNLERVLGPPPPAAVPPQTQTPIRVGSTVRSPQKIRHADPVYPQIAQAARIQGVVIIEATIGADGRVVNARILRSLPMLDQSALDAVRQWEFMPSLLNGVPVPVIMTVTVNFTLTR